MTVFYNKISRNLVAEKEVAPLEPQLQSYSLSHASAPGLGLGAAREKLCREYSAKKSFAFLKEYTYFSCPFVCDYLIHVFISLLTMSNMAQILRMFLKGERNHRGKCY